MSDNHTHKDKLWTNPFEYDLDFHHCLGDHTPQFGSQCLYSKWEFYMFFFSSMYFDDREVNPRVDQLGLCLKTLYVQVFKFLQKKCLILLLLLYG